VFVDVVLCYGHVRARGGKNARWDCISARTASFQSCFASQSSFNPLKTGEVNVILWPTVSRPVYLGVKPDLGTKTGFLLLSDSFGFADLGRPLWGEDGSFTIAAGLRQHSHSRVWVSRDTWPYFSVTDSRLPFSSPPPTRRATTVEILELASTRVSTPPRNPLNTEFLLKNI
jgi:hypothetical protein